MLGEFGRTPKLGGNIGTPQYVPDGRDHWAGVFFAVLAGAGVQGGQVIGRSDKIAAFRHRRRTTPPTWARDYRGVMRYSLSAVGFHVWDGPHRIEQTARSQEQALFTLLPIHAGTTLILRSQPVSADTSTTTLLPDEGDPDQAE
jgi:hypothetical protein